MLLMRDSFVRRGDLLHRQIARLLDDVKYNFKRERQVDDGPLNTLQVAIEDFERVIEHQRKLVKGALSLVK